MPEFVPLLRWSEAVDCPFTDQHTPTCRTRVGCTLMEAARLERESGRQLLGAKRLLRETITVGGLSAITFSQMQPEERGFRLTLKTRRH